MATAFGKELRKIRVDKDENIYTMAKKLDISISYLSSIESGKRRIPEGMVDQVITVYKLSKERSELLRQAEAESSSDISIDLSNVSNEQKRLVFVLSRKLNDLSDEDCFKMLEKLKKLWVKTKFHP